MAPEVPVSAAAYALLTVGSHHGAEVPADAADAKWWAVVQDDEGAWSLQEAKIAVTPEDDPVLDEGGGPPTGRRVTLPDLPNAAPVVLIRGEGLTAGPLVVATEEPRPLFPGDSQPLSLPSATEPLVLTAYGKVARSDRQLTMFESYGLLATAKGRPVDVFAEAELDREGQLPRVLLAGDIDRDGAMDLLVDTSDHYNVSELTLFLSSEAESGRPPKEVARYRTTGA